VVEYGLLLPLCCLLHYNWGGGLTLVMLARKVVDPSHIAPLNLNEGRPVRVAGVAAVQLTEGFGKHQPRVGGVLTCQSSTAC